MFRFLAFAILLPCLGSAKINDQLELLMDIQGGDSVLSITQTGPERISVLVADSAGGRQRTLEGAVTPNILTRLKASADAESIPWKVSDIQPVPAKVQDAPEATAPRSRDDGTEESANRSSLRKNKFKYVSTQSLFSAYTYGIALPIALEAPDKAFAMGLLAYPISFGAHYMTAWDKEYHDSHLFATSYFATNSLILSYSLPFLVIGPDFNAFRVGSFAILAAYPLSLHYGYKHGTRFQDEPGRVSLQSSYAFTMGWMGYFALPIWAEMVDDEEVGVRLALAQILGAAIGGHYLSYKYRTNEKVPGGIGPGIGTFSLLGAMVAGSFLATIETDRPQAIGWTMVAGIGGGFYAGQRYFLDKYDNFERASYNSLGMMAGILTPLGIMALSESAPDDPATFAWIATGGAFAGYFLTRMATSSLVERPRPIAAAPGFFKHLAVNPIPVPVPEYRDGKHSVKLVAQVLTASF